VIHLRPSETPLAVKRRDATLSLITHSNLNPTTHETSQTLQPLTKQLSEGAELARSSVFYESASHNQHAGYELTD